MSILVLARNEAECTRWRRHAGLTQRQAQYLAPVATKGRRLTYGDIVVLSGFWHRSDVQEFRAVLAPAGVVLDRIHQVRWRG